MAKSTHFLRTAMIYIIMFLFNLFVISAMVSFNLCLMSEVKPKQNTFFKIFLFICTIFNFVVSKE